MGVGNNPKSGFATGRPPSESRTWLLFLVVQRQAFQDRNCLAGTILSVVACDDHHFDPMLTGLPQCLLPGDTAQDGFPVVRPQHIRAAAHVGRHLYCVRQEHGADANQSTQADPQRALGNALLRCARRWCAASGRCPDRLRAYCLRRQRFESPAEYVVNPCSVIRHTPRT